VAIEQLQQELTTSRKEEQAIREEAQRVCSILMAAVSLPDGSTASKQNNSQMQ
jgi:hypothetical protein